MTSSTVARLRAERDVHLLSISQMESGQLRTHYGASLSNDTTAASIAVARETVAQIDRLIAAYSG